MILNKGIHITKLSNQRVYIRKKALKLRGLDDKPIAFPCSFGRPAEDTLKTLRKSLDKTPRALI